MHGGECNHSYFKDGTVRQHDLRVGHSCKQGCPPALLEMPIELSTISMSPRTPYQFVVAGYSHYVSFALIPIGTLNWNDYV